MQQYAGQLYRALIREELHPLLAKQGFRGGVRGFRRRGDGVRHLVVPQKSRSSTASEVKFTINLGVASERLLACREIDPARCGISDCHWRTRLGSISDASRDVWWSLHDGPSYDSAARQVTDWLEASGLPELEKLKDDSAIRDMWLNGNGQGLTEAQRLINLSVLLRQLGPRDEAEAVLRELEKLAASTRAPAVSRYLKGLGRSG